MYDYCSNSLAFVIFQIGLAAIINQKYLERTEFPTELKGQLEQILKLL